VISYQGAPLRAPPPTEYTSSTTWSVHGNNPATYPKSKAQNQGKASQEEDVLSPKEMFLMSEEVDEILNIEAGEFEELFESLGYSLHTTGATQAEDLDDELYEAN
jgi:hypothetical protein